MADISITPANVVASTGAVIVTGTIGETITAGMAVYLKASDNRYWKAQCDDAANDECAGIALNGGAAGQPVSVQTGGTITIGATVVVGTIYVVSATAGGIAPVTDLVSTNYVSIVGVASTAGAIVMNRNNTGIQVA